LKSLEIYRKKGAAESGECSFSQLGTTKTIRRSRFVLIRLHLKGLIALPPRRRVNPPFGCSIKLIYRGIFRGFALSLSAILRFEVIKSRSSLKKPSGFSEKHGCKLVIQGRKWQKGRARSVTRAKKEKVDALSSRRAVCRYSRTTRRPGVNQDANKQFPRVTSYLW